MPSTFSRVGAGSAGSASKARGTSSTPPAVNCQEVNASADTGGCQRRLSTVPSAIDAALASPAATPTGSSAAFGPSTSSATPPMPARAASTARPRTGAPSKARASRITTSGWIAPRVAATPPGRR